MKVFGEKRKESKIMRFYGLSLFILFPLCLLKTISKMRYASTFSVFSVFLVIIIVLIQCLSFYHHNEVKETRDKYF